ncbi:type IIG restriction enzyme/methyltransferase [Spirosoma fluminis]
MRLSLRKPTQSLHKAYAKQSISPDRMDTFRRALARLFSRLDEAESEDYQKTIVAGFFSEAFSGNTFGISARDRTDLFIHHSQNNQDQPGIDFPAMASPGVIIKTKKVFAGEMMTTLKNNVRALHELILYYFDEQERGPDGGLRHLIITDVYNWFVFDESDFRRFFYGNPKLWKLYQIKQQQKKDDLFFYSETARILRELDEEVPVTCLNLREIAEALDWPAEKGNQALIPVFKLFSPEHLLKLPFANDANTLNRRFYDELLYIVGVHETFEGGLKRIQRLPEGERLTGSLLENTINRLRTKNVLTGLDNRNQYGTDENNQLVNVGLELCITWISRLLFLKWLEGQLRRFHQHDRSVEFLTVRSIPSFDGLNELFFDVLPVPEHQRSASVTNRYGPVPYLNSSLFERTALEQKTLSINALEDGPELPVFRQTALNDWPVNFQTARLPTLQYLLAFLDAYDFSTDGPAEVQPDNKAPISAVALGLIFEKLNGYRAGSFFTPGFIATYLVGDSIRKAVVTHFNERFGWTCADITALNERLDEVSVQEATTVVNSLRIVDPAVGSGHFLVAALNELIALKAELGILVDREGRRLHHQVWVVEDELIITNEDGEIFQYVAPDIRNPNGTMRVSSFQQSDGQRWAATSETQRVQETIFHEKQAILENCLFGVDSSPTAVNLCRLRLSIELLKSAYYYVGERGTLTLVTLPDLDMTIKTGNTLVNRFDLSFQMDTLRNPGLRDKYRAAFQQYSADVRAYKHTTDKAEKERLRTGIHHFQELLSQMALTEQKDYADIRRLETKLAQSALPFNFVNHSAQFQTLTEQLEQKKQAFAHKQRVFNQAFEWRYAFPEVLDEAGNYVGFDLVVSHPPCGRPIGSTAKKYLNNTYNATADLYSLFLERGLQLVKPQGRLAYILPTSWQTDSDQYPVRKLLLENATLEAGIVLPRSAVEDAAPGLGIYLMRKGHQEAFTSAVFTFAPDGTIAGQLASDLPFTSIPSSAWTTSPGLELIFDRQIIAIKQRLAGCPKTIGNISTAARGITVNRKDVSDHQIDETYVPFFSGTLTRYASPLPDSFVHFGERPSASYALMSSERILVKQKLGQPSRLIASWAEGRFATKVDVYAIIITDPAFSTKYVLAIINSSLATYLKTAGLLSTGKQSQSQLTLNDIRSIPIPDATLEAQAPLIALVDKILLAKRADLKADTSALEAQLGELVLDRYGLTAEERAIISPVIPDKAVDPEAGETPNQ